MTLGEEILEPHDNTDGEIWDDDVGAEIITRTLRDGGEDVTEEATEEDQQVPVEDGLALFLIADDYFIATSAIQTFESLFENVGVSVILCLTIFSRSIHIEGFGNKVLSRQVLFELNKLN